VSRERALGRLGGGSFDLLVVGAGIIGSRVAYEAAHHGLRVALIDAGDFGGGTSSASSKLVHGGLRYLATGDLRLVRQLQAERRTLANSVAPHLVRPLPLLLAADRGKAAEMVAALTLYGALTASRREVPRLVGPARAHALVSSLDLSATSLLGVVPEAQTHDARLTLATVRGAAARGAVTLNYVRLDSFQQRHGRIVGATLVDLGSGAALTVRCRAAVNAAGAWVDHVRRPRIPGLGR
jgi:glycerol-3-phosphate dehydrogenase